MVDYHQIGKFVLLKELPETPLGRNFRAAELGQTGLNRIVHLTRLIDEVSNEDRFQQLLRVKFTGMGNLLHEGIVKPYEVNNIAGVFASQEFVEGVSLKAVVNRCVKNQLPFSVDYAIYTAARLCNTLEYTHSQIVGNIPLIHGGLTPYNIYYTFAGDVKIMDWGIVSSVDSMAAGRNLFLQRYQLYLSPAQAEGRPISVTTDIFQVGLILYELLTGAPLFTINRQEKVEAMVEALYTSQKSIDGKAIPTEIINIISKALSDNPATGYQNMKAMREDIDTLLYSGTYLATATKTSFFLNSVYKEEIKVLQNNLHRELSMNYAHYIAGASAPQTGTGEAEVVSADEISAQILPEAGEIFVEDEDIHSEVDDQFITYTRRKKNPFAIVGAFIAVALLTVIIMLAILGGKESEVKTIRRPEDIQREQEYNQMRNTVQQLQSKIDEDVKAREVAEKQLMELEQKRIQDAKVQSALASEEAKMHQAMLEEQRKKEEEDRIKREKAEADRLEQERLAKQAAAFESSTRTTTTPNPTTSRTATQPTATTNTPTRTATATTQPRTGTAATNQEPPVVGSDEEGLVLTQTNQVPPQYPRSLKRSGIRKTGTVRLMVLIGANGVPEDVRPLAGEKVFFSEAIKAVRQWRWAPPKRNGQPVRVTYVVAVNF